MSKLLNLLLIIISINCLVVSQVLAEKVVVYKGGTVVDPNLKMPLEDAVIIIRNGYIDAVGTVETIPIPPNADIIDISNHWVTPGLVDAHIHFSQSGSLYTRPDGLDFRQVRSYQSDRAHSKAQLPFTLRRYLASGVTAVVDVGGPQSNFSIRELTGDVSPRVALAGPLLATLSPSFEQKVARLDLGGDPTIISVSDADSARTLVRAQLDLKPDLIKVWYIDSRVRPAVDSYDTVLAIIQEAHKYNVRVAVHATELETARLAVQAGADILVHAVDDKPVDTDFITALKEHDVIVITTAVVYEHTGQLYSREVELSTIEKALGDQVAISSWEETPAEIKSLATAEAINARVSMILSNLKTLVDAGVRIAVGTDAGNPGTLHGPSIHRELALLEGAGFSAAQILRAATIDAASVFAENPAFGSIAPGNRADLLVLSANPTLNVKAFQAIKNVVLGGVSHDPAEIAPLSPVTLVQRQLDAYNAHDIKDFIATYSVDAELYELPASEPNIVGQKDLMIRYENLFKKHKPNCRLLSRIVQGSFVIDQEFCKFGEESRIRASAIYQVEDNLIRRVWFVKGR